MNDFDPVAGSQSLPTIPQTAAGKEMWRLAEAVAVKLEPEGGGPLVDVAVLAVQMIRQQVIVIEREAAALGAEIVPKGSLEALIGMLEVVQASPIVQDDDGACWFCLAPYSHEAHADDCPYSEGFRALAAKLCDAR